MVENSQTFDGQWVTIPFSEYFTFLPTNTFSREQLSDHGAIGNVHYGDILTQYGSVLSKKDYIPKVRDASKLGAKHYLHKNDVIIADTAEDETVGKTVQIGDIGIPMVSGLHTMACRPNYPTAEKFLGYYINSVFFHNQILPYITGIKVSSISKKSIGKTELYIPADKVEQEAIASVLSDFDEHIDNLTELIEKKKAIRDGALEDLVSGKTRLDGFDGEWEIVKFGSITIILNGDRGINYPSESAFTSFGIPFVNAGHLQKGKVSFVNMDYISREHYSRLGGGKIRKNDILLCLRGSLGKFALVDFNEGAPASSLCIVRNRENSDPLFLAQLMSSSIIQNCIEAANTGSSQPNLSAKEVLQFEVIIPINIKEQQAIAQILTAMDEEIASLEEEKAKMVQIREGAMGDLLTGRVRLQV